MRSIAYTGPTLLLYNAEYLTCNTALGELISIHDLTVEPGAELVLWWQYYSLVARRENRESEYAKQYVKLFTPRWVTIRLYITNKYICGSERGREGWRERGMEGGREEEKRCRRTGAEEQSILHPSHHQTTPVHPSLWGPQALNTKLSSATHTHTHTHTARGRKGDK